MCVGAGSVGLAQGKKPAGENAAVGTWTGNWTGGSSGALEIVISKGSDGKLTGSITASPSGGDPYTSKFKSFSVTGNKMMAKLEDPEGEVEISIEATIESSAMKGTYSVRSKEQGQDIESGTWAANKKSA